MGETNDRPGESVRGLGLILLGVTADLAAL